jgi:hypothetical protein
MTKLAKPNMIINVSKTVKQHHPPPWEYADHPLRQPSIAILVYHKQHDIRTYIRFFLTKLSIPINVRINPLKPNEVLGT